MKHLFKVTTIAGALALALTGCNQQADTNNQQQTKAPTTASVKTLTAKDVDAFLSRVEKEINTLNVEGARAEWIYQNFITEDTAALSSAAGKKSTEAGVKFAMEAAKFDDVQVSAEQRRKLEVLKQALVIPAPQDSAKTTELATLAADMGSMYGKGTYTTQAGEQLSLVAMSRKMATSRNYDELLELWQGWRTVSPAMKPLYERQAELGNEGAQALGYADVGAMWRSKYDMPADDFAKELDRLWGQVKPLYDDLHCYVRAELGEHYGEEKVPQSGPIPAHLLGNMWAQQWGNIYDLVAPENADPGYDVTEQLAQT